MNPGDRPSPGEGDAPAEGPLSFEPDEEGWAHRRDPDLEPGPSGAVPPPARPRSSPYLWIFGIVVVLLMSYIGLNTLRNAGSVSRGIQPGKPLPPFAAPLALSRLRGDPNVATAPNQGQRGRRPACTVRGRDVLNLCELADRTPLVLAFVATDSPPCGQQLDGLERVRRTFPGVEVAALAAGTDRRRLRGQIRRRGWSFPIGYDEHGGVFALYGVVDCPTMVFAYPGRIAMQTTLKRLGDARLRAEIRRLVDGSRRRGWKPPAPA